MNHRLFDRASAVTALYVAITLVMTWPIALGLGRDIPGDLGDPAFVAGIIAWGANHWMQLFTGHLTAAARFWDAPFFAPEPMAIVYSEHLALHSLLTLPAYAITRNPVLSYNLWFLSTFVLSGLGMYLLVRELTGRSIAAFAAGLAFAFAPYRIGSVVHLQVLSSQWMPFVLFALRRYFAGRNTDALLGAGAALWAQNLSSGYYLLFFGPFVALFALVEMTTRQLLRQVEVWRDLAVTAGAAIAATLPFAMPYIIQHAATTRTLGEVVNYSADLKSWLTASEVMTLWGRAHGFVKPEGLLFPGLTVVALAACGIGRSMRVGLAPSRNVRLSGRLPVAPGRPVQSDGQGARVALIFGTTTLILSFWLSLGPQIQLETHPTGLPALYRLVWEYVPGFGAARAPARFGMITVLALSMLAGIGLAALDVPGRRRFLPIAVVLLLAEGAAFPLSVNRTWSSAPDEFRQPEPQLHPLAEASPVYQFISQLPDPVTVAHFPFGLPEREIQYTYYAALHGKRIVNGYSGAFPLGYTRAVQSLRAPLADPVTANYVLERAGTTHIVVHRSTYVADRGVQVVNMFISNGWQRIAAFDGDVVLAKSR